MKGGALAPQPPFSPPMACTDGKSVEFALSAIWHMEISTENNLACPNLETYVHLNTW